MLTVGLTGGIGSGKTQVATVFRALGVPVFNSDLEARWLQENNENVKEGIRQYFGKGIYENGKLIREKLASLVFSDQNKLIRLNQIIHPAVKEHFEKWKSRQNFPLVIKEAAILIESGAYQFVDEIILVVAPERIRIERVVQRDNVSPEQVVLRMKHQMTDEKKREYANYIITNDEKSMILPQILDIYKTLLKKAQNK